MNYFEFTQIPKGEEGIPGGVYYVDFPEYQNKVIGGLGNGKFGQWVNKMALKTGITSVPLGHAGVMIVDENGNTKYYEYGRYKQSDNKTIGIESNNGAGNWRRVTVPNAAMTNGSLDHDGTAKRLAKSFGKDVDLVYVDDADPVKVNAAILESSKDADRPGYHLLGANCGSEACRVIDEGQSKTTNVLEGLTRTAKGALLGGAAGGGVGALVGAGLSYLRGLTPSAKKRALQREGHASGSYNIEN